MKNFALPGSMIFAALLICTAYIYAEGVPINGLILSGEKKNDHEVIERNRPDFAVSPERSEHRMIKGSPDAPITIVEFSDLECVFCQRLHPTLDRLVSEYPEVVKWEFRHLPLVMHINARSAALAAECVGELAGMGAFWDFTDFLFANQGSFAPALYEEGAAVHGVESSALSQCMDSDDIKARLLTDEQIALALGAGGTPYNVIVYEDGTTKPVVGALPYEEWVKLLN